MSIGNMDLFFFNDTATTEIYTLSLHDALPICAREVTAPWRDVQRARMILYAAEGLLDIEIAARLRSEEHTSELQSRQYLVCRLLLEKKTPQQLLNTGTVVARVRLIVRGQYPSH